MDVELHRAKFERLKTVRADLLERARAVRDLSAVRRGLIQELIQLGYSQSDIARELEVSRQAIQKMLAA